ncbi:hypothetical protein ETAA8_06700 [Anatilimnocola aggregata]|uniref:Uncharacterized protein n=1 Tax=Anatilimnocola aggregata TaxID=2528021 RepID=A0A517Y5V6_9BACT|nr:hypothetical protein [Anatilimnocola aggregata]QDU25600.1 hypothetical protein ETAA8_06700 [Anatilimnocola aggregata]
MLESIAHEEFRQTYLAAAECLQCSHELVALAKANDIIPDGYYDSIAWIIQSLRLSLDELEEWLETPEIYSCIVRAVLQEPSIAGERFPSCHHLAMNVAQHTIKFFETGLIDQGTWRPISDEFWPIAHMAFTRLESTDQYEHESWPGYRDLLLAESVRASYLCTSPPDNPLEASEVPPDYRDGGNMNGEPLTATYIASEGTTWGLSAGDLSGYRRSQKIQTIYAKIDSNRSVRVHNYHDLLQIREERARRGLEND